MKAFLTSLICLSVLLFYNCQGIDDPFFKNGKSPYVIHWDGKDSLHYEAAIMLQDYLKQITEVEIAVVSDPVEQHGIFISDGSALRESLKDSLVALHPDAFALHTLDGNLYLSGASAHACTYAVATLLEEHFGVMKYNAKEEYVPEVRTLKLPVMSKIYTPDFDFRLPHFQGRYNEDFCKWHKVSNFNDWGMFVHTFQKLIPPEKYFDEHPEYFALMGDKRVPDAQLCLSNREVIHTLIKNLGKLMEAEPDKVYWSVSQSDMINYCECEMCKEKYEEYESVSGLYVEMANHIATAYPDKQISTLAYQFTRSAPKHITPRDNVNIMFCSIECNRSQALAEDRRSEGFVKDLKDWAALTDNIFMWDYIVQFKNYFCPFPNFHVLQPNIDLFHEHGVKMMFQQGSGGSWSDLSDIKQYLVAKLLWNHQLDADSIVEHYIASYYGDAAPYIQDYYEEVHQAMIEHQEEGELNIYGFPMTYAQSFLQEEMLVHYKELMDKAEKAVDDDSLYLKRVLRQRLAIDFAYLDVALNTNSEKLYFVKKQADGSKEVNKEMLDILDKMVQNAALTQTQHVNERNLTAEDYRKYVQRKVELMATENKLHGAEITSLTPWSDKYPVGGMAALTDGITGGLKFSYHWLGYEGEDILLNIDLKELKTLSGVKMNFLRDNLSWVFLPREVNIELSSDGTQYHQVAGYQSDTIENFVLETSVPFDFDFESTEARYMRISAKSVKTCPKWHRGYGGKAWLFLDEIVVE